HPDDLRRRLSVVFDECLGRTSLTDKRTLDAGCGYGPFSAAAVRAGAAVVSVDIGERLVARTVARAGSRGLVADVCHLAFRDESFDVVISSEMLEHTETPARGRGARAHPPSERVARADHTQPRVAGCRASRQPAQAETVPWTGEFRRVA